MSEIKYEINKNESITRWWTSDVKITPFESPCKTFDAEINSGEGYVQIIYPVREAFIKQHSLSNVERYKKDYDHVYFPFENNRVDFSTFISTPHKMEVHALTSIEVNETKKYSFEIYTCGAIKIWVDKKVKLEFSPFTRNIATSTVLDLLLTEGKHTIEVYAEELAERDVFFYFEIRSLNDEKIIGVLPFNGDANILNNYENWLKSCHFKRDVYTEGVIYLDFDNCPFNEGIELLLGVDKKDSPDLFDEDVINYQIKNNQKSITLGNVKDFRTGVYKLKLGINIENQTVYRILLLAIRPPLDIEKTPLDSINERKKQAASYIIENGTDSITTSLLMIDREKKVSKKCEQGILKSLKTIEEKADCADFVFSPMLILIKRYKEYLSTELYNKIYNNIINFRFWIDEPGNDVMWYFSENHALLFHTAQFLSGQMFPDAVFSVSKNKGKVQEQIGKKRLISWFDSFFKFGFGEWNSATYIPIDLIGFFSLYELSEDIEIKNLAKKALDYVFELIAYASFNGILSTSYGRCYEKTLKSREQVETSFFSWIAFKEGFVGRRTQAVPLFCLSNYTCDIKISDYNPEKNKNLIFKQGQGLKKVNIYTYKTEDYMLSSVQAFNPYKHGHQQHIMNVTLAKNCEQFYINNPGERSFSGENRPSYWAGNGTNPYVFQEKNTLLMDFKIEEKELVHAIHAYVLFDNYDATIEENNYLFLKKDDTYLAIWFSNGYKKTTSGANTKKEVIAKGLNQAVIIKCGCKRDDSSFTDFINSFKASKITYNKEKNYLTFEELKSNKMEIRDTQSYLNNQLVKFDYDYNLEKIEEFL